MGSSKTAIAQKLGISRSRVSNLVKQLIVARAKGRQRISGLRRYHKQINRWVKLGFDLKSMRENLEKLNMKVHISTINRYVRKHCDLSSPPYCDLPGKTGYLSVIRITPSGDTCLFILILGYSRYGSFHLLRLPQLTSFLNCHIACFKHLGGVPCRIKLCELSGLNLSASDLASYKQFLTYYGASTEDRVCDASHERFYREQVQEIIKQILGIFFHCDYKRFSKTIQHKYTPAFNLSVHPLTGRPVNKEFTGAEKNKLLSLPKKHFQLPTIEIRVISQRGRVFYHNQFYKLSTSYKGTKVVIQRQSGLLTFLINGKIIHTCRYRKQNKNKCYANTHPGKKNTKITGTENRAGNNRKKSRGNSPPGKSRKK